MEPHRRPTASRPMKTLDSRPGPVAEGECHSHCALVFTRDGRFLAPARADCGDDDDFCPLVPVRMHWLPTEATVFFGEPDSRTCLCLRYTPRPLAAADATVFVDAAYAEWHESHGTAQCVPPRDIDPRATDSTDHCPDAWPRLARIYGWGVARVRTSDSTMWLFQRSAVLAVLRDADCVAPISDPSAVVSVYGLDVHVATDDERRELARKYTLGFTRDYARAPLFTYEVEESSPAKRPRRVGARPDRSLPVLPDVRKKAHVTIDLTVDDDNDEDEPAHAAPGSPVLP